MRRTLVPLGVGGKSRIFVAEKTDHKSFGMETLYDLLGALPNDDADELRAAFRRAVKRAHPDVNPEDPDAGLKFRRIMRANEILGDVEQRAAYDRLLEHVELEQENAARRAATARIHEIASRVMALAGISTVVVGGYALFLQLSTNALSPATSTAEAAREPAAIAAGPAGEEAALSLAVSPQTPGLPDVTNSTIAPAGGSMQSEIADGRIGSLLVHPPKHSHKLPSANIDRSIILNHLRKFTHAFAELAQAKGRQKAVGQKP